MKAAALVLLSSSVLAGGYGQLPLAFEPNQGQTDAQVKYLARGDGYALFLTGSGAVLKLGGAVVRMRLAGANAHAQARGLDRLPGKSHYFTGNNPAQWRTNIAQYARVWFEEVYPGISLVYYGNQRQLEYDFVVAPGADPRRIQLEFEGTENVRVDSGGDLVLRTATGEVRQRKPLVLQGQRVVTGRYVVSM